MVYLVLMGWRRCAFVTGDADAVSGRAEKAPIYRPADALAGVCGRDRTN